MTNKDYEDISSLLYSILEKSPDLQDDISRILNLYIEKRDENKSAKDEEDAWDIQETYSHQSHGWIQWKGTTACMDIHCNCGWQGHVDSSFLYYIKCPKCKSIYMLNGHIEFIKITDTVPDNIMEIFDGDINIEEILDKFEENKDEITK